MGIDEALADRKLATSVFPVQHRQGAAVDGSDKFTTDQNPLMFLLI
jgi:hypothetical protein